jgi:hypothetical protein
VVRKNLARETEDLQRLELPGIPRQASLAAGFRQERLSIQCVLDGNLGQEQTAVPVFDNEKAVTANFDFFGANRGRRRKQRNFNLQIRDFFGADGRETRVVQSSARGAVGNACAQGFLSLNDADASAQFSLNVKRYEDSADLRKNGDGRRSWICIAGHRRLDGLAGKFKKRAAVFLRQDELRK